MPECIDGPTPVAVKLNRTFEVESVVWRSSDIDCDIVARELDRLRSAPDRSHREHGGARHNRRRVDEGRIPPHRGTLDDAETAARVRYTGHGATIDDHHPPSTSFPGASVTRITRHIVCGGCAKGGTVRRPGLTVALTCDADDPLLMRDRVHHAGAERHVIVGRSYGGLGLIPFGFRNCCFWRFIMLYLFGSSPIL